MEELINKLQDDSYELLKQLELMKYALVGFMETYYDAYCFAEFYDNIITKFRNLQEEIERIRQEECRIRLNLK